VAPARADDDGLAALVQVLQQIDDDGVRRDLLIGMREGLKGRKDVPLPDGWTKIYPTLAKSANAQVRDYARALAITFDDPTAIAEVRAVALAKTASATERNAALQMLVDKRLADFAPTLQTLLDDPVVQRTALRGLAAYDDPHSAKMILERYPRLDSDARQDALTTLATRKQSATELVAAVEQNIIPRRDLSAFLVRQLHALKDEDLSRRLRAAWGDIRETPQDKQAKIAKYTQLLNGDVLAQGNAAAGRAIFERTCKQCHTLYGEGAKIGPDLTGSNRANLEYVLTNVIDPSAAIAREYKMNIIITADGRVLTGMIVEKTGDRITLQTVNERIVLVEDDIEDLQESPVSMMPEGQIDALTPEQVRDLVAYLATKQQVELEGTK
jgi:putative heme-binding domain-containing protein